MSFTNLQQEKAEPKNELYSLTNLLEQAVKARDLQVLKYILNQDSQETIQSTLLNYHPPIQSFVSLLLDTAGSKSNLAKPCMTWLKQTIILKKQEILGDSELLQRLQNFHLFDRFKANRVQRLQRMKKKIDLLLKQNKKAKEMQQIEITRRGSLLSIEGFEDETEQHMLGGEPLNLEKRTFGKAQVVVFEEEDILVEDEKEGEHLFDLETGPDTQIDYGLEEEIDDSIDDSVSEDDVDELERIERFEEEKEELMHRQIHDEPNQIMDFESDDNDGGIDSDLEEIKFDDKPKVKWGDNPKKQD